MNLSGGKEFELLGRGSSLFVPIVETLMREDAFP